jgi:hypothetical protein
MSKIVHCRSCGADVVAPACDGGYVQTSRCLKWRTPKERREYLRIVRSEPSGMRNT